MSLPPSSHARPASTPAGVPASQNTAPVIKFRCLYTHDIRRKAKRWQDGYLKFHTFNKRAMVYDDAGNFIGDHHWRESQDIQDGDELELDKGVLIQVGECMETTQTDISVLFERRKASQESPQQQRTPAPPPPAASSHPRQLPSVRPLKSLNDLLGIKRGPLGRSVTPQSPYEQCHRPQRQVESRKQEGERPAKRPKPDPPSEILQRKSANESLRKRSEVVIELDKSGPLNSRTSSKSVSAADVRSTETPTKSSNVSPGIPQDSQSVQTRVSIPKPPIKSLPDMPPSSKKPPEKPKSVLIDGEIPINPLRMRSEKPRPKLMYRALLPPKTANALASGEAQTDSNPTVANCTDIDFSLSASTLAVLEELGTEDSNAGMNTTATTRSHPLTPKTSTSQTLRTRLLNRIPTHAEVYGSLASPAGVELGIEFGPSPSSSPEIQVPNHDTSTAAHHRLVPAVVRSHSDISTMVPEPIPIDEVTNSAPGPSAARASLAPVAAIARSERKLFRKSHSDTNALRNVETANDGPSRPLATRGPPREVRNDKNVVQNDYGPWTAEALDFFDWWPPGRTIPT